MSAPSPESRFLRASAVNFAFTGSARLLNFVAMSLLVAHYFGASRETDALFLASALPLAVITTLFSNSVNYLFVSVFNEDRAKLGEREGQRVALGIFALALVAVGTMSALGALGAKSLAVYLAPGFDAETLDLAAWLIRLFCAWMIFATLNTLLSNTFYAYQRFVEPGAAGLLPPLGAVVSLACCGLSLGVTSILLGLIAGSACQALLQLILLVRRCRFQLWQRPRLLHAEVRRMVFLSLPLLAGTAAFPAYVVVTRVLASRLPPGSLTCLEFATKLVEGLSFLLIQPASAAMAPAMSLQSARDDRQGLASSLTLGARWLAVFLFPLGLGLIQLRKETVEILFARGAFSAEALAMTSVALGWLALGMFVQPLNSMIIQIFYATQRTYALFAGNMAGLMGGILSAVLLSERFGLAGLSVSIPVAYLCQVTALVIQNRRIAGFPTWPTAVSLGRTGVAAISGAAVFAVISSLGSGGRGGAAYAFAGAAAGIGLYIALLRLLRAGLVRPLGPARGEPPMGTF